MTRLALLLLLAIPPAADAKCAMTELAPKLITPAGAKIPADGGVLVGWRSDVDREGKRPKDPLAPRYRLSDGKAPVDTVADPIAPGVYVYHPKKAGTGKLVLVDDKTEVARFEQGNTDKLSLGAPSVKGAKMESVDEDYHGIFHYLHVDVAQVPDAAVGVILYDSKHTALAFVTVPHDKAGATTIDAYQDPSRCSFNPDGMKAPDDHDKVTIAWVDAYGRIGKPSDAFGFTAAKK